jgi:hypothetical protein
MFAVVTTVSQVAQKSTRPIWMLEKLSLASMGGAAASADRAPPSADRQMVSFLRHEASVMIVPVFASHAGSLIGRELTVVML